MATPNPAARAGLIYGPPHRRCVTLVQQSHARGPPCGYVKPVMNETGARTVTYRLHYGPGLVVKRLLLREGFNVDGPRFRPRSRVCSFSVVVESDGRADRVGELMRRWAPAAYALIGNDRSAVEKHGAGPTFAITDDGVTAPA